MTKEELDKIKKHLLVGGEIGLPHYSHKTTVDKTVLDQLVRGVESLHQQLEAAHAFHDVAVKQRDAREWMLRDAERERDEARHALHEILAVIHRDGGHYTGEHGIAKSVEDAHAAWAAMMREIDKLRAERRQLRARLVECLPWVGVCPLEPNRIQSMQLVRDLADDTLAEVKP